MEVEVAPVHFHGNDGYLFCPVFLRLHSSMSGRDVPRSEQLDIVLNPGQRLVMSCIIALDLSSRFRVEG